jgi:chromosome segregation ATPase
MSTINHFDEAAAIREKIDATRKQLTTLRSQRDALQRQRDADPYDCRLVPAIAQANLRVTALSKQADSLERDLRSLQPADAQTDRISNGQVWIGSAWGDSRTGGNY